VFPFDRIYRIIRIAVQEWRGTEDNRWMAVDGRIKNLQILKSPNAIVNREIANRKFSLPSANYPLPSTNQAANCGILRFPWANLCRVPGRFWRGFGASGKNLQKSSPDPLRPNARFGILLTRCAEQGESHGRRGRGL